MKLGKFPTTILNRAVRLITDKIEKNKEELDRLLSIKDKSYLNFVRPYMELSYELSALFSPVSHLNGVKNSERSQKVLNKCIPLISTYYTQLAQDERVYKTFKKIYSKGGLNSAQYKVLEDSILDFELSGVNLPKKEKKRVEEINLRLSLLSEEFNQNVLNDTLKYKIVITDPAVLGDMPESDKLAAQKQGGWEFGLLPPSYLAFMTHAADRSKREEVYRAYTTRAPQNGKIITEILALREELADILGCKNYAELNIKRMSAPNSESVAAFLTSLAEECTPFAERELKQLTEFAEKLGVNDLAAYDLAFYSEKLKKSIFDYNEEQTRPYFELNSVVNGLFSVLNRLFGLSFEKKEVKLWDEGAAFYNVYLKGRLIGGLYTDLCAREDKRGGAWMDDWHTYHRDHKGKIHLPEVMVVGNFPPILDGKPSLLRHNDLTTLFHEMGHALHHLLSQVEEAAVSGIKGIDWDTVEFPSQFLENFGYEPEVLDEISSHFETGEKLPSALRDEIYASKNFQAGLSMLRQLEFGVFDISIHMQGALSEDEVQAVLDDVRKRYAVIAPPSYNKFQNGFSHIFGGGYAAGYYSYKWAEMLAADAFLEFQKRGVFNKDLAEAYLNTVLKLGASKKMDEIYRSFLGRDPKPSSLIELYGLK
ncbi:MAG: M3 family metallopeptidase [Deferribacteraceae bacterium]|jgi:oligopeptidase A|nr:M3 family metallopeptidase [Deferribacteraceae bacterium]